jgi:hypothetical protein
MKRSNEKNVLSDGSATDDDDDDDDDDDAMAVDDVVKSVNVDVVLSLLSVSSTTFDDCDVIIGGTLSSLPSSTTSNSITSVSNTNNHLALPSRQKSHLPLVFVVEFATACSASSSSPTTTPPASSSSACCRRRRTINSRRKNETILCQ